MPNPAGLRLSRRLSCVFSYWAGDLPRTDIKLRAIGVVSSDLARISEHTYHYYTAVRAILRELLTAAGVFDSLTSVVTQRLAVVLPSPSPLDSGPVSGYGACF